MVRSCAGLRGRGGIEHSVRQQLKHPQFVMNVNDNDIALLMVYPTFRYSRAVRPIRLPEVSSRPQVGEYVSAYGWGYTKETGDPSEYLRYVSIPVFPHEECAEIYRSILNVTYQMICAGFRDGGRDACVLDSGGPLVWNGRLQGLVSWGYGCARTLRPGVYTDLSAPQIQNWILSVIQL
ncbi:trypsin-2-like [Arctopsyche grandis]|uniref:trypsin-2-like n=1 Tax=Arctopsyche grandis TaxID=121162 RepID=UPI00406D6D7D